MKALETILANAARSTRTIVLPEADDPRILEAAVKAASDGIARIILIGDPAKTEAQLAKTGKGMPASLTVIDPQTSNLTEALTTLYFSLRKHRGVSEQDAIEAARKPHVFAALLVRAGHADGTLGGATLKTAEIVRTALQIIGPKQGSTLVSSFFLMLCCEGHHQKKGAYVFADAGLVIDPDAAELSDIAIASAQSYQALTGEEPRVAMLSFSTRGSASHAAVNKVETATALARQKKPDLCIDGAMQFDAAFVPAISKTKSAGSPLAGNANIFIFPNLDAGNIGYKIAQRIGGAVAIGPILQGLEKPANDLSRGCSAEDVLHMIAVTACQSVR